MYMYQIHIISVNEIVKGSPQYRLITWICLGLCRFMYSFYFEFILKVLITSLMHWLCWGLVVHSGLPYSQILQHFIFRGCWYFQQMSKPPHS